MATPLVIPNALMFTLNWSGETRTWKNVVGILSTGTFPTVDQTFANSQFSSMRASMVASGMLPLLASTVVLESMSVRAINIANQPEFIGTGTPLAGGGTTDCLPLNVAMCITLRTAMAGKSFRGRIYFSGWDEATNLATARSDPAVGTACVNFLSTWNTNLAASGLAQAVLSRPAPAKTIPEKVFAGRAGQATRVTIQLARSDKWDSQRRRTGRD